ncbi:UNVERIFIED_CONTAM: hypothetical protein FKN15_052460 [Acipenser sinensis]
MQGVGSDLASTVSLHRSAATPTGQAPRELGGDDLLGWSLSPEAGSLPTSAVKFLGVKKTQIGSWDRRMPTEPRAPELCKYRTQLWDKQTAAFLPSTPGLGMHVEVKDPDTKVVLSRQYGAEGRFTFTSHTPGEHQICLHSNSSKMALFTGGKLYREERFRMTSESTNQRVLWWSITQTVILLITGIWQMRHLKSFFEAKKLV